jgi:hypothetical protein
VTLRIYLSRLEAFQIRLRDLLKGANAIEWLPYLCAFAIGTWLVISIFPRDLLTSVSIPDARLAGDATAHVEGQRAFFSDDWHWPLLKTTMLDWPTGVSIAMTDSIPLIALPLKLLRAWLPSDFTTIFLWLALAYVLQPIAAVFALRSAGEKRLVPAIAVSLFAVSTPSFLYRHPHSALSSHFLLLLALASYFRTTRNLTGQMWLPPLILLLSTLVHPYLAFMALSILAAAPASLFLRLDLRWIPASIVLAGGIIVLIPVCWSLGYVATNPSGGFGLNSMNAIAPFYPNYSFFFGRSLTFLDPTGAQYEGYQYLGVGLIFLATVTLLTSIFSTRTLFLRRHLGLVVISLVLTALAVSTTVYAGTHKIYELKPVPGVLEQLRSSGRLFWPVTYILFIGCVAGLSRLMPTPANFVFLTVGALLQLQDTHDLRHIARRDFRAVHQEPIDTARLASLLENQKHLTILPTFGCGADANAPEFMQLILAATRQHVTSNTMYVARFAQLSDCSMTTASRQELSPDEVRVFLPSYAHTAPFLIHDYDKYCRALGTLSVCTKKVAPLEGLRPVVAQRIPLGRELPTSVSGYPAILGPGWYLPEPDGVWSIEATATLVVDLDPPQNGPVDLKIKWQGFTSVHGKPQLVRIRVNGVEAGIASVPDREDGFLRLRLPANDLMSGPQVIEFQIAHPVRPSEVGLGNDTRRLGLFLRTVEFDAVGP